MITHYEHPEVRPRVEPAALDLWVKTDLRRRYGEPEALPDELLQLVERVCMRD